MLDTNQLISLIVPFYNCEKYIEECIKSLINQDYDNIEIILINDGSTDLSREIAKRYAEKDKRIRVVEQENSGVSVARNKGMELAKGEYIAFVDADDFIEKNYISFLYGLITNNNVDISVSLGIRKFDKYGREKKTKEQMQQSIILDKIKATEELLYYNIGVQPFNKLISRNLINKNNIKFEESIAYGEDFIFNIDCFINANAVAVGDKIIYNYRVDNENSAMTKLKPRLIKDNIKAQEIIKNKIEKRNINLKKACCYAKWHTYCDCLNTIVGCGEKKKYKNEYNMLKNICKKYAIYGLKAKISKKEKIKCLLYLFSPYLSAKIVNHFRIRKFSK